jgi:glycerol-3-phosphate dehydrogenase
VDAAAHSLRTTTDLFLQESITDRVRLLGAEGYETRFNQRVLLARRSGLHVARIDHLLHRYGGLIDELLALIGSRWALAEPLAGAEDYLAAEVVYAVTHEGARHLDDVLARRTRISIETFDRGVSAAPGVARLMAAELDWSPARTQEEIDHYLRRVQAERLSQQMLTDAEADQARLKVSDIV